MRGPGCRASFGACVLHLSPQGRTVGGDFTDGDDLLPVQSDQGVQFLDGLQEGRRGGAVCLSVCHPGHKRVSVRVSASVRVRVGSDSSISTLTIRLPCTDPSVLSRRSGPLCATLVGKMIPEVLGRFFRPYGAEHMHAKPPAELSPRQTNLSGGVLGSADAAALTGQKKRAVGRTEPQQLPLHPSAEESPSAPPGDKRGHFSLFLPFREPTDGRSEAERGSDTHRATDVCTISSATSRPGACLAFLWGGVGGTAIYRLIIINRRAGLNIQ